MSDKKIDQTEAESQDVADADEAVALSVKKKNKKPKNRKKFLLLCGHPAHTDPRILYMADTLARLGEVSIVACSSYGEKDENAEIYRRHSTRSFKSAKNRSLWSVFCEYWRWFNPMNLSLVFNILRFGFKHWMGVKMGHMRDLTLGFILYYARCLTQKEFDCIVCCDAYMMEGTIAASMVNPGIQIIFDAHEVFYSEINQDATHERKLRKVEEGWLRHVDRLFVVSRGIQALYLRRNPDLKGRVHYLPNAIPFCGVKRETIIANMSGTVKFLFQGGYHRTRGIDRLLEIWAELPACDASLTLRMVGYTKDEYSELKELAGRARNAVIFDDPVKEDELVNACVGFDVGVIPYPPEPSLGNLYCCPNKFGQYMNAGCAVLVTNSRSLRRLVKDNGCGWSYDANNIGQSVEVFRSIIGDRQALYDKRLRGLHQAEHSYNWDVVDKIVETVIKK